ncbi:MAG TPA: sodium-translocating pyrophosphatase [Bryobacteraceae bacterium]|jgi:K(+)-stimulated pyrophosphate-energized sodium pump|nr:sodium-translocating pyrophosphatase [Bryobacteraceae bacterium]
MHSFIAPLALWLQTVAIPPEASTYLFLSLAISVASLVVAVLFARYVTTRDNGTPAMQKISNAIKAGAEAFLRRQYRTIILLAVILAILIFIGYSLGQGHAALAGRMTISFVVGATCSLAAGFSGMWVSIRTNIRVASAARTTLNGALQIALRGGAVTGLSVVALSLLGVGCLFWYFGGLTNPEEVPAQIVAFGFGASFVALFAQLGGGIYTKAADVGADLVGKVEAGIPEDDPRNPAVIADLVGDNVGDCAGRGADLFESTAAENIGAMILGVSLYPVFGIKGVLFPLMARAFGLIASIVGVFMVKTKEDQDPMKALNRGFYVTTILALVGFYAAVQILLQGNMMLFLAGVLGIATSFLFVFITQYYTEYRYRPVQEIAKACTTGPATTIITGFAVGLECVALPVITIVAAILGSYYLGTHSGISEMAPGITEQAAGLYGTAVATMGMLSTAAYILAMDTFGPITDNAGGIVEMSHQDEKVRERTDRLDSVGNTTKALTKGYAIGSAALAAFLLFSAYIDQVRSLLHWEPTRAFVIDIGNVPIFTAALLGAMLVFLFSALAIRAVSRAAQTVIEEVRRQFHSDPGIMAGTSDPDYGTCVDIVTKGALKAMVAPGILPVVAPVTVGLIFRYFSNDTSTTPLGAAAVAAFLMVGTISGVLMATLMNNGGGAWDNAKKYIETGAYGGKGSPAHKAAVVGDTVGDPFKDTAGPSLHVLIKLLSTITLVAAPLFL